MAKKRGFLDGYKTHDGPLGSPSEWREAFFERMGIDEALEILGDNDPLTLFGLKSNATWDEVVKAYRRKAKECHPDKGGTKEMMQKVNAAFEVLEARMKK